MQAAAILRAAVAGLPRLILAEALLTLLGRAALARSIRAWEEGFGKRKSAARKGRFLYFSGPVIVESC